MGKERERNLGKEGGSIGRRASWFLLGAIALTSFSLIAFEIALSRLLSVLLSYHYVFVVLSLALLGLGMGGMFVHFFRFGENTGEKKVALLAILYSLAIPFSILLILQTGYLGHSQINLLFSGFLLFLPFFFAGALFAKVYQIFPSISGRIYGVDLIGAAAGSLGAILLLNLFGGILTHFVLGLAASTAAILFAMGEPKRNRKGLLGSVATLAILIILLGVNLGDRNLLDISIAENPGKEIHDAFSSFQGKIIETRWSAFGRTDLVEYGRYPDHMDLYIDGTAGSPMYKFNGKVDDPGTAIESLKKDFPGYFPFFSLREDEKNHILVIGPGGGRDILLALMGGVQKITAVEVDRDLVDLVRNYSRYNGGIYDHFRNVKIVVEEGRHFLKRAREKYDLILLSLPVTNTSRSLEGYALTENFLFTTDAIHDYLNHLTDEGRLIVVGHNDAEILRLLSISLVALGKRGTPQVSAMKQIYIVGSDEYPVFVMKKAPFEQKEIFELFNALIQKGIEKRLSYFPYIRQEEGLNPALAALGLGVLGLHDLIRMVEEKGFDISAVTDDRPFFYKIEKGIPRAIWLVFWPSAAICLLTLFFPFIKKNKPKAAETHDLMKLVLLFFLIGTGFMLIEISFIQRFGLFLGQPVLSLSVLLFSLLAGAGLGSLWSGRIGSDKIKKGIGIASLIVGAITITYTFLLPGILNQLLGLDLSIRMATTILLLIPLGFFMGSPFPLGIRLLKEMAMESKIPWMWGVNGVSSVFGSVLTIVIAISIGFTGALLLSACCYFIIFFIFLKS
jgi:predicted membrane-bound spermidine synthase